jgi:hypothetical protein
MKLQRSVAIAAVAFAITIGAALAAEDISGTWLFSVDLDDGGHGDPTFVLKQTGENVTGTYTGPLGEFKVAGTVKDKNAVLGFEFTREGQVIKATYTGTIESPTKMSGTVAFAASGGGGGTTGKWTAAKKQ